MSNRDEFQEFLMFNLKEINQSVSDPATRVYKLITTVAAGGDQMMESMFCSYVEECDLPTEILIPELSFFRGMNLFHVICDCGDVFCAIRDTSNGRWFDEGQNALTNETEEYTMIRNQIRELRDIIET